MERYTDEDGREWVTAGALCVGDYGGAGTVGEANIRSLKSEFPDHWEQSMHYGRQLWLPADNPECVEVVERLERDYPLFDEEEHSRVEMEWKEELWQNDLCSDLLRTLPDVLQACVESLGWDVRETEGVLWEAYRAAMEETNTYPEFEYSGAYVRTDRISDEWGAEVRRTALEACLEKGRPAVEGDVFDHATMLVLSDYLEETGNVECAEFVRWWLGGPDGLDDNAARVKDRAEIHLGKGA